MLHSYACWPARQSLLYTSASMQAQDVRSTYSATKRTASSSRQVPLEAHTCLSGSSVQAALSAGCASSSGITHLKWRAAATQDELIAFSTGCSLSSLLSRLSGGVQQCTLLVLSCILVSLALHLLRARCVGNEAQKGQWQQGRQCAHLRNTPMLTGGSCRLQTSSSGLFRGG
jgi:hypothetical protein